MIVMRASWKIGATQMSNPRLRTNCICKEFSCQLKSATEAKYLDYQEVCRTGRKT